MPELLLFAYDHRTASPPPAVWQIAALPKPGDLITWQRDGWRWGSQELAHPWFRIVTWPAALPADLDSLLSPLPPSGGTLPRGTSAGTPRYLGQYRGFYLTLPPTLASWWADAGRPAPSAPMPTDAVLAAVKTARAAIANPQYIGPDPTVIG